MSDKAKNILVAPLNWGLGHASRCIPIIKALEKNGFIPILASDGQAYLLLQKEFPHLKLLELPSYQVEYPKNGDDFKWKMLKSMPRMLDAIRNEKKVVKNWVAEFNICGIISDNRLGVVSKKVPSIFITHQLNVLSGNTSWLSGKLHRLIIEKFTECWVPDLDGVMNFSGKLGHLKTTHLNIKYIGPLTRFENKLLPMEHDLMVILSGPEPQRGMLEEKLLKELKGYDGKILFIKGVVEPQQRIGHDGQMTIYNFMASDELEIAINQSRMLLCRSGYTTLMDLAKLGKKAFFIPTPGQFEQEYLARRMKKKGFAPYAQQSDFRLENLLETDLYKGFPDLSAEIHWKNLFCLFESE